MHATTQVQKHRGSLHLHHIINCIWPRFNTQAQARVARNCRVPVFALLSHQMLERLICGSIGLLLISRSASALGIKGPGRQQLCPLPPSAKAKLMKHHRIWELAGWHDAASQSQLKWLHVLPIFTTFIPIVLIAGDWDGKNMIYSLHILR